MSTAAFDIHRTRLFMDLAKTVYLFVLRFYNNMQTQKRILKAAGAQFFLHH